MYVLIVDDDPTCLKIFEGVIKKIKEANTIAVSSGEEALKQIQTIKFAVIVMDVNMPGGLNGLETLELIRKFDEHRNLPVILLTASEFDSESIISGYMKGAVDYLMKSSPTDFLLAKVKFFIELYKNKEELRNVNEKLSIQTNLLVEKNNELEAFNHMLAHDLRNHLNTINAYGELLEEEVDIKLSESGKKYFQLLKNSGSRMTELINDLLHFFQINAEPILRKKVDLTSLAKYIIENLKRMEPNRKVDFIISDSLILNGDNGLFKIVLENLFENAWKYSRNNEITIIEFSKKESGNGNTIFYIKDNGSGFDMKQADKLFIPFSRLHIESEYKGTGLGLVTIQRILQKHGGRIWVESEKNIGATFYFSID